MGFFHSEDSEQELAFRFAIERINHDISILPDTVLVPIIEHISVFDSFNTSLRVCNLTKNGIGGIFGPQSTETSVVVNSICSVMDVPHLETLWDLSSVPVASTVNLFPETGLLAKALFEVIEDMDWASYTIIYEDDEALIRFQELLKSHKRGYTSEGHVPFTVWQLLDDEDQRPLLKEIKNSSASRIVLDCSTDKILTILEQAKEVNLVGEYQNFFLTSLDAHTLDFGEFKYGKTNITALRLIDPQRHMVQAAVHDLTFAEEKRKRPLLLTPDTVKTESALIFDAVNLFAKALHGINQDLSVKSLSCYELDKWEYGYSLVEHMKLIEMEGMSGKIKFDNNGRRTFFTLDVTQLMSTGFRKIGSWDPENRMTYTRSKSEMERELFQSISNKTFIVVSRLGEPYLREKDPNAQGNERFEGFSLDLIDEIAKDLKFQYKFVLAPDGQYGSYNHETKQWNGLIKELRDRKADLAICDLTITYERRSAVDFTMPFMPLGISILFSKPTKQPPDLFSFLSPLSLDVWIYMATAYLGVSLILYFLARCTPNEWENPHPCNPDPTELECQFSLHNCLWFSIGSLMAQGCDLLPKISPIEWKNPHPCNPDSGVLENSWTMTNVIWHNCGSLMQQGSDVVSQAISTRVVAGMWWFFVLIMISSYTANLAAFLTMERMDATIESVEDLAKQSKIKYGVLNGGSTANFFKTSNDSLYQKMWSVMESTKPSVFTSSNDEGVERVLKGKRGYAFFMESTSIEYQIEKHCDLMQVGRTLDSKGYGIAMPFNSPYRIAISGSVLKFQESGKIKQLKNRWWKRGDKSACRDDAGKTASNELGLSNVGGVFLVLLAGCTVAFFVAILEFLWNVRKVAVQEKISPREAFIHEFMFAVQCYLKTKPVRHTKEEEEDDDDDEAVVVEKDDSFLHINAYDDLNVEDND
ncbi:glutamate receptor ionotropic, kainate 2-like isoform X2 [Rhodnius prolixus]|uniref:glutamate receptor ionotropic, kainate 2-like isoform X2 n=1 Tax=Rhodnius prolixus TaxID=13249 RepID=UPI003D18836C